LVCGPRTLAAGFTLDDVLFIHTDDFQGSARVMHDVIVAQGIVERLIYKALTARGQDTIDVPFHQLDKVFGDSDGSAVFIFPWNLENFACMPLGVEDAKYMFGVVEEDGTCVKTKMDAHSLEEMRVRVMKRSYWNS